MHLKQVGVRVNKICHSDKIITIETTQIFADQIGDGKVYELSGMNPNDDVIEFTITLKENNTMYVGYLPHVGKLVSYHFTGNEGSAVVKFVNSGVVCVEKDNTGFYMEWYLKPSIC